MSITLFLVNQIMAVLQYKAQQKHHLLIAFSSSEQANATIIIAAQKEEALTVSQYLRFLA